MQGHHDRQGRARQAGQDSAEALGRVGVVVAVHRGEHVVAVAGRAHARAPALEHVAERVAGDVDLALDSFLLQVALRSGARSAQHLCQLVGLDAVVLLGHVLAIGAKARLDMRSKAHRPQQPPARRKAWRWCRRARSPRRGARSRSALPSAPGREPTCSAAAREPTPRLWWGRGSLVARICPSDIASS